MLLPSLSIVFQLGVTKPELSAFGARTEIQKTFSTVGAKGLHSLSYDPSIQIAPPYLTYDTEELYWST